MPAQQLLDKALKVADEAEIFHLVQRDEPVIFEANRLKLVERRETSGVALRLIKDGRVGFSSSTNLEDLDGLVQNALEVSSLGPEASLQFPANRSFDSVEVYDPEVEQVTVEEMVHLGQTLIDQVREGYPDLVCEAHASKSVSTISILNSRGGSASYSKTVFSLSGHGTLVSDTDMLFVSDWASSCRPIRNVGELVANIRLQLQRSQRIVDAPPGDGTACVVFTPRGLEAALLSPLLAGFNGKTVLQGASPLVGKLGEQMVDHRFSLWDEPALPFAPGSRMCDDEGVPTRTFPLIENGIVRSFLYDLETAARAGADSTGSAHRGLGSLPEPGTSVVSVTKGDAPFASMIENIQQGLVVESLLGAGQSNIQGGDFKANVLLGYRVEKGEIIGRVKNTVISGNAYEVLNGVEALEDTAHWVGGSLKAPALASYKVTVAA